MKRLIVISTLFTVIGLACPSPLWASTVQVEVIHLILDFYADWCAPCVVLDSRVFKDPEIVRFSRKFINMRLDLTRRHPSQDEILRRYGVRGVPTVIFFNREGVEENDLRIEYLVGKNEFSVRMKKILGESGAAP